MYFVCFRFCHWLRVWPVQVPMLPPVSSLFLGAFLDVVSSLLPLTHSKCLLTPAPVATQCLESMQDLIPCPTRSFVRHLILPLFNHQKVITNVGGDDSACIARCWLSMFCETVVVVNMKILSFIICNAADMIISSSILKVLLALTTLIHVDKKQFLCWQHWFKACLAVSVLQ